MHTVKGLMKTQGDSRLQARKRGLTRNQLLAAVLAPSLENFERVNVYDMSHRSVEFCHDSPSGLAVVVFSRSVVSASLRPHSL